MTYIDGLMVSTVEINRNVAPHYVMSRHFLILSVLSSPFHHSTTFQRVTKIVCKMLQI